MLYVCRYVVCLGDCCVCLFVWFEVVYSCGDWGFFWGLVGDKFLKYGI